ncbi:MAG: hypothetical protein WB441_14795 [Nocardioidaceae bacterium]
MDISTISRLASAAVVTGVAGVVLAAPAQAIVPDSPGYGSGPAAVVEEGGTNWAAVTAGGVGGLALVGAGVVVSRRRHHHVPPMGHPA